LGRRLRLVLGVTLSILLGVTATVISGEYKVGWEILLVDIPLVAVSASVGVLVTRAIFARLATRHSAI
jgi:hypothetical protein